MIEDQNVTINGRSKRASLRRRRSKGRTIRKVMGGGGEFSSRRNFFSLSNSLHEFFLDHSMNIF